HLSILLILILISCKNDSKKELATENGIDASVYEMWNDYTESNPQANKEELPESWFFHDNKEDAERLAALTVNGKKTATTSGLYQWYVEAEADLSQIGTNHIITDFDGKARAVIEITNVDTIPFNQLSESLAALDMGTDKEALNKWRKAHWSYFESVMAENGEEPTEDMLIVFERFKTVWRK
ncbi:MAG: ASCH domain-containing protein, partial [Maribacter sp.]|nr:ASCH domain-containing protein [Maribacter sp.]